MTTIEIEPGTIRRVDELEKLFDDSDDSAFCHLRRAQATAGGAIVWSSVTTCCGLPVATTGCRGRRRSQIWDGEKMCRSCSRPICPDCVAGSSR